MDAEIGLGRFLHVYAPFPCSRIPYGWLLPAWIGSGMMGVPGLLISTAGRLPLPPACDAGYGGRWLQTDEGVSDASIGARVGERVTLEIIGINGAEHVASLPPFRQAFTVKRGQVTRVTLGASRAGLFPILWVTHQPTMTGYLLVLPK